MFQMELLDNEFNCKIASVKRNISNRDETSDWEKLCHKKPLRNTQFMMKTIRLQQRSFRLQPSKASNSDKKQLK